MGSGVQIPQASTFLFRARALTLGMGRVLVQTAQDAASTATQPCPLPRTPHPFLPELEAGPRKVLWMA